MADPSQHELDALRTALDQRLAALEAGLANPDGSEALENLVIELARVATAEADATATRVCLQARREALVRECQFAVPPDSAPER